MAVFSVLIYINSVTKAVLYVPLVIIDREQSFGGDFLQRWPLLRLLDANPLSQTGLSQVPPRTPHLSWIRVEKRATVRKLYWKRRLQSITPAAF